MQTEKVLQTKGMEILFVTPWFFSFSENLKTYLGLKESKDHHRQSETGE